uniref:hypothetical protein n=1 Tax=Alloprevotella sp. TaxID=1872471 RepID=UPI0040292C1F
MSYNAGAATDDYVRQRKFFIEHHSFEAFNEGVRLKECIDYQEKLIGIAVKRVGVDTIYANNAN